MREFLSIAKALSDENRVRALLALAGGECCVCQIIELLGLAPSTVSKHMSILHQARLVDARKEGRWMYYRLSGEDAPQAARDAIAWVVRALGESKTAREDAKVLKGILKCDPEKLCRRQSRKRSKKETAR